MAVKDTLQTVNAHNMAAFMPKEEPKKETLFGTGGSMETEKKKHKDELRTVNKHNLASFNKKENLFDGISGSSRIDYANDAFFGGSSKSKTLSLLDPDKFGGSNYKAPIFTPKIDWSNGFQSAVALGQTKALVNSFGSDTSIDLGKSNQMLTDTISTNAGAKGGGMGKAALGQAAMGAGLAIMNSIDTGDKRGMWDTLDPVYHLAGGRESAAGNAMSDAGVTLTQAGLSSGQPYLALAGAGLKVIGGLTNAAFGIKENKEMKKRADASINANTNFMSNASSFDAIKGPAARTNTNVYEGGWFSGGKAADKNEALAREMANAFSWADRSVQNNISNIAADQIADAMRNYSAFGGYLTRSKRRRKIKK